MNMGVHHQGDATDTAKGIIAGLALAAMFWAFILAGIALVMR